MFGDTLGTNPTVCLICIPLPRSAEGLTSVLVTSYGDIESLMEQGAVNRTVAFTNMNASSSRAHTLIAVQLTQRRRNAAGQETAMTSAINLVDLAGR